MSFLNQSNINGLQIKRDRDFSNLTIQCDPNNNLGGKLAVEHNICNMDVPNLTVTGSLTVTDANAIANICNITCDNDLSLHAGNNVLVTADQDVSVTADGEVDIEAAGGNVNITAVAPGFGDIILTTNGAGGHITLDAADDVNITATLGDIKIDAIAGNTLVDGLTGGGVGTGVSIASARGVGIGFYGNTPTVRPNNSIVGAAVGGPGVGAAVLVDTTFGGYNIAQIAAALQTLGLLEP